MSKQKVCHKPVALSLKYDVLKKGQETLGRLFTLNTVKQDDNQEIYLQNNFLPGQGKKL